MDEEVVRMAKWLCNSSGEILNAISDNSRHRHKYIQRLKLFYSQLERSVKHVPRTLVGYIVISKKEYLSKITKSVGEIEAYAKQNYKFIDCIYSTHIGDAHSALPHSSSQQDNFVITMIYGLNSSVDDLIRFMPKLRKVIYNNCNQNELSGILPGIYECIVSRHETIPSIHDLARFARDMFNRFGVVVTPKREDPFQIITQGLQSTDGFLFSTYNWYRIDDTYN